MRLFLVLLAVIVTSGGCFSDRAIRQEQGLPRKHAISQAEDTEEINAEQINLPIHYETKAEVSRRLLAIPKEPSPVPPITQPLKHLYGKRPLELARITKITVPHYVPRSSSQITRSQVVEAISRYVLVDREGPSMKLKSIPLGAGVIVEYDNKPNLVINMFRGIPYTAYLHGESGISLYGLARISEPDAPADADRPRR